MDRRRPRRACRTRSRKPSSIPTPSTARADTLGGGDARAVSPPSHHVANHRLGEHMTTTSDGLTAPFALARYRDGDAVRLGLVAGDRIRAVSDDDLGAPGLNAFLARSEWNRLKALAEAD